VRVGTVARGEHLAAIRRNGLRISSESGEYAQVLPASETIADFTGVRYIIATFKAHQWAQALPQIVDGISQGATLVTLQNGLPFWYFADRSLESVDPDGIVRGKIPDERIIGGVAHASGEIVAPGYVRQSGGTFYPMGELAGSLSARVSDLSAYFTRAGLQAPVETQIRRVVWRKLLGNLALNPVSALTGMRVGTLLERSQTREILRAIIDEGLIVAKATGVDPGLDAEERLRMAGSIANVKTSMLQDLEAGRALELDPICGAVSELAEIFTKLRDVDAAVAAPQPGSAPASNKKRARRDAQRPVRAMQDRGTRAPRHRAPRAAAARLPHPDARPSPLPAAPANRRRPPGHKPAAEPEPQLWAYAQVGSRTSVVSLRGPVPAIVPLPGLQHLPVQARIALAQEVFR